MIPAIEWEDGRLVLLDQRYLPGRIEFVRCRDFREIAGAIKDMVVRGAPAIGIAGGYAVAVAVRECRDGARGTDGKDRPLAIEADLEKCAAFLKEAADHISAARPTAVNLMWAVDRVLEKALSVLRDILRAGSGLETALAEAYTSALEEARAIEREDLEMNKRIGANGARLIRPGSRVLTHCNAGALATGGYGTALGVIRKAWEEKKISMVYACETRPYLQGARLTAWELTQDGIDVTLLVDSAAGYLMSKGMVDCVVVGADRIALNGDVANKIGTYTLACLAGIHDIPFYVAAPTSTFDPTISDMSAIPVEERSPEEVLHFRGAPTGPEGVKAVNPSFDLTPHKLISAIITEKGVIEPPIPENLPRVIKG
ncbi:MAG: S-methyl-5-thioribose-1-phosphate isomerase [Bacillota bacterium]|jgi:methylthioribose-1-phosphate isomerase|nr:S-methyl-5-thioribose-1-phosphate isomerase [Candidatus Fermentithermobacillaceae bacterium]